MKHVGFFNKVLSDKKILELFYSVTFKPKLKPIACYDFNDNANDSCGSYNGTWNGNEQYGNGINGQAAKFDGSSCISLEPCLGDIYNSKFSFSLWAYLTDSAKDTYQTFLALEDHSEVNGNHSFFVGTAYGDLEFACEGNYNDASHIGYKSGNGVPLNEWFNVVLTFDGQNIKIYKNGQLYGQTKKPSSTYYKKTNYIIGGRKERNSCYIKNGLIDEVKIFNQTLTEKEVLEVYKEKPKPKPKLDPRLIASFPLTDNATDLTGNHITKFHGDGFVLDKTLGKCAIFNYHSSDTYLLGTNHGIKDTNIYSLSVWYKVSPGNETMQYFTSPLEADSNRWYLQTNNDGSMGIWSPHGTVYSPTKDCIKADNKWYHLVWVLNKQRNMLTVYSNGIKKGEMSFDFALGNPGGIGLGGRSNCFNRDYALITDLRVFNTPISDEDVEKIYKERTLTLYDTDFYLDLNKNLVNRINCRNNPSSDAPIVYKDNAIYLSNKNCINLTTPDTLGINNNNYCFSLKYKGTGNLGLGNVYGSNGSFLFIQKDKVMIHYAGGVHFSYDFNSEDKWHYIV